MVSIKDELVTSAHNVVVKSDKLIGDDIEEYCKGIVDIEGKVRWADRPLTPTEAYPIC